MAALYTPPSNPIQFKYEYTLSIYLILSILPALIQKAKRYFECSLAVYDHCLTNSSIHALNTHLQTQFKDHLHLSLQHAQQPVLLFRTLFFLLFNRPVFSLCTLQFPRAPFSAAGKLSSKCDVVCYINIAIF